MKKILFILFLTSSVVFGWTGDMIINGTSYNLSPNTDYNNPQWQNANLSGVTLNNCTFKLYGNVGPINFSNADLSNSRFISLSETQSYTFYFRNVNFYNANLRGISTKWNDEEAVTRQDTISCTQANFDYADLRNCDINISISASSSAMASALYANFSDSKLYNPQFNYTDFSYSIFKNTVFDGSPSFMNCILSYSDFSDTLFYGGPNFNDSTMIDANFSNAGFSGGTFWRTDASRANFTGAEFIVSDFNSAILLETDFSNSLMIDNSFISADASRANFTGTDLTNADFSSATLVGADFSNSVLLGAKFENADLSYANFQNANLSGMSLKNTNLQGTDFTGADLTNVDLTGAHLIDTILDSAVVGGITSFLSFQTQDEKAVLTSASNTIMNLQQSLQLASNTISQLEQSSVSTNQAMAMMRDLRVGSQTFSVSNGNAKIRMYVDESGNLTDWTNTSHVLELDIPADTDTKFFRFRMD